MKLTVVDTTGKELRQIDAADDVFGIEPNGSVLHQAYVAQMANRRGGNANTKTRGEVAGSTAKTRKQKGSGNSRQGSIKGPTHVGGGISHGPRAHSFAKGLPRQMGRLALRSALSSHAAGGSITVVEGLVPSEPKTKEVLATLAAIGVQRTALVVSGEYEVNLTRASRNIEAVKALPAANLNVVDLINAHHVIMTEDAVRKVEALWSGANLKPARGRREAVNA